MQPMNKQKTRGVGVPKVLVGTKNKKEKKKKKRKTTQKKIHQKKMKP